MAGSSGQARIMRCFESPEIDVVSCHAFSHDLQLLALCPNNEEVHIFSVGQDFKREHVLSKHTQRVSGLAFSCHGKLASVAEDRTAFVWEWDQVSRSWQSTIVELRTSRAALCVEWAPDGLRFAAAMSSKDVAVCSYEEEIQVWKATKVGKYKAAATTIAWHPTSLYLATGSTDRVCHVYDVNEGGQTFGEAQVTEDMGAWINAVAFSETGRYLACVPHDSTVRFKDLSLGPTSPSTRVRWRGLPFSSVMFVGETCVIACGFDKVPVLFRLNSSDVWQVYGSVDVAPKAALADAGAFKNAQNMFKSMDRQGQDSKANAAATLHTNTITSCRSAGGTQFSTSALDGKVAVWELAA